MDDVKLLRAELKEHGVTDADLINMAEGAFSRLRTQARMILGNPVEVDARRVAKQAQAVQERRRQIGEGLRA